MLRRVWSLNSYAWNREIISFLRDGNWAKMSAKVKWFSPPPPALRVAPCITRVSNERQDRWRETKDCESVNCKGVVVETSQRCSRRCWRVARAVWMGDSEPVKGVCKPPRERRLGQWRINAETLLSVREASLGFKEGS